MLRAKKPEPAENTLGLGLIAGCAVNIAQPTQHDRVSLKEIVGFLELANGGREVFLLCVHQAKVLVSYRKIEIKLEGPVQRSQCLIVTAHPVETKSYSLIDDQREGIQFYSPPVFRDRLLPPALGVQ